MSDNAGHDYDECTGRSADKEVGASEERNEETGYYGCNQTLLWSDSAGDTECNCKRKGDDAHNDAGNQVRKEFVAIIATWFEQSEEFRLEYVFKS